MTTRKESTPSSKNVLHEGDGVKADVLPTWAVILISVLSGAGGGTLLKFALDELFARRRNDQSATKLLRFKTDLDQIANDKAHEHQRMMQDYTLFANRKHEIYPKLYESLLYGESGLRTLRRARMPFATAKLVDLDAWKDAQTQVQKAHDSWILARLYLADETDNAVGELTRSLWGLFQQITDNFAEKSSHQREWDKWLQGIESQRIRVLNLMKQDIRTGEPSTMTKMSEPPATP